MLSNLNLTLFFTDGVGLSTWAEVGNIDREIMIYQLLADHLRSVNFITFGGEGDKTYSKQMGKIDLCPVPWHPSRIIKVAQLLLRHWSVLIKSDILKTNQIKGSEVPLWLKKWFGKKIIVRCGYLPSRFALLQGDTSEILHKYRALEQRAFEMADLGVVTTYRDFEWIVNSYGVSREKLRVVPNYVCTDVFKPYPDTVPPEYDVVYVGRSGPQKNLTALLESLKLLNRWGRRVRALLIGGCSSDEMLKQIVDDERLEVVFMRNVPNAELSRYLRAAKCFILPSHYEGHPKVLLEAMSCALPCIGADVEGIREQITHRVNGYLCGTGADSIADAIESVLGNAALRQTMGENARKYVVENYALEKVLNLELDVMREVLSK